MKRNNAQNSSAKKKLIPAVAMFTASAVMLSTATYAWFTMNKNAKVTGLNMTATAGGSIEISLGQLDGNIPTDGKITTPTMDNKSWKNVIAVSDYYDTIGKIKPASSIDGDKLFYVSDEDVYAGGTAVNDKATITQTTDTDNVKLNVRTTANNDGSSLADAKDDTKNGYYVDVPVWIRTTKTTAQTVTCDVIISDADPDMADAVDGEELQKAVRVAVIPLDTNANVGVAAAAPAIETKAAYNKSNLDVFATDYTYYTEKSAINATKTAAETSYADKLAPYTFTDNNAKKQEETDGSANTKAIFDLTPTTAENTYSVQAFVVRVWLEGESTSCKDANASQDWNIQLNFSGADKVGE